MALGMRLKSCLPQIFTSLHERRVIIRRVVGKEHLLDGQLFHGMSLPRLQPGRFKPAGKLDGAILRPQHFKHSRKVFIRAGQKIVIQHVPPACDRQFPYVPLPFRDSAEPAMIRTTP